MAAIETYRGSYDFELLAGTDALSIYQFGDGDLRHYFCKRCGISPFSEVERVPAPYEGPAKPGYRRVNLGCVDGLDALALDIELVDGRSF